MRDGTTRTLRLAALGCVSFAVGACVPPGDPGWRNAFMARDPLVNGPFLIGAERPVVGTGCVRSASVRSQDARALWFPCRHEVLLPPPSLPVAVVEPLPPAGSYVVPGAAPPPDAYGPPVRGPSRAPSRGRSAWDG